MTGFRPWGHDMLHDDDLHEWDAPRPLPPATGTGDTMLFASFLAVHAAGVGLIVAAGVRGPTWLAAVGAAVMVGWWAGAIGAEL